MNQQRRQKCGKEKGKNGTNHAARPAEALVQPMKNSKEAAGPRRLHFTSGLAAGLAGEGLAAGAAAGAGEESFLADCL